LSYTYPLFIATISYSLARQRPRSWRIVAAMVAIVVGAGLMEI